MLPGIKQAPIKFGDLMVYLVLVIKHLRLMILTIAVALLAGLTLFVYARPVYYVRSLINVEALVSPVTLDDATRANSLDGLRGAFFTAHMVERTAKRYGIHSTDKYINLKYFKKVETRINSERNLEISVWSFRKDIAESWSKNMLEEYLQARVEARQRSRTVIMEDFTQEMARLNVKMQEWLNTNSDFKDTNKLAALNVRLRGLQAVPERIMQIDNRIEDLQSAAKRVANPKLSILEKLSLMAPYAGAIDYSVGQTLNLPQGSQTGVFNDGAVSNPANASSATTREIVIIPSMTQNGAAPQWAELEKEYRILIQKRQELSGTFLPAHPRMKAVERDLERVQRGLEGELKSVMDRLNIQLLTLKDQKSQLEAKLPEYADASKELNRLNLAHGQLAAGQLPWQSWYNSMAKSISTLEYGDNKERYRFEYMGAVEQRLSPPASPNRLRLVMMAGGLGFVMALVIPFLLEYLDHTLNNIESAEQMLSLRGLGIVPETEASPDQFGIASSAAAASPQLEENFRVIRTNLQLSGVDSTHGQVIMIASAMPQEGKTVVASNVAASFARRGESVLLIDADLRRGRLHRLLDEKSSPGLSEVLQAKNKLIEAIRPTGVDRMSLLPCGKYSDNVTELVAGKAFSRLLAELRGQYDRIIVDTPPVLGIAETSALQAAVDGVIFVISSGRTPMRNVKVAIDTLKANGAKFFGFVLNRLDLSTTSNYYYYYYYSNQYYQNYRDFEKPEKPVRAEKV